MKRKTQGQGLIEYALILGLVAVVVIVCLVILRPLFQNAFSQEAIAEREKSNNAVWTEIEPPHPYYGLCYTIRTSGYIVCIPADEL